MIPTPHVPAWARVLIGLIAGRADREDLLVNLEEGAARLAETQCADAARRWCRSQVLRSLLPLLGRRVTGPGGPAPAVRGVGLDVRYALRSLSASRGFASAVVLMLTLGLAAHTVVYAVVDAMVLRPLPFGDRSSRLVTVHSVHPTLAEDWNDAGVSYPDLVDFRSATTLESLEAVAERDVSVSSGPETERVSAASVTPGLLPMLGVAPVMGRPFALGDAAEPGFEQVILLGHSLWQSLYGADPNVVGKPALLNGRQLTVIGVLPPGFSFPEDQQLYLPYRGRDTAGRGNRGLLAVGLIAAGFSRDQNLGELRALAGDLARRHPDTNRDWSVQTHPIRTYFVSGSDATLMLIAVSALLLLVSANVAGLVVARGLARERELGVRAALGAGRGRLVRLLTVEVLVLAAVSTASAILAARWGLGAFLAWTPEPPPYWAQPGVDWRVTLFASAVAGGVAMLAGLMPALRLTRVEQFRAFSKHTAGLS